MLGAVRPATTARACSVLAEPDPPGEPAAMRQGNCELELNGRRLAILHGAHRRPSKRDVTSRGRLVHICRARQRDPVGRVERRAHRGHTRGSGRHGRLWQQSVS